MKESDIMDLINQFFDGDIDESALDETGKEKITAYRKAIKQYFSSMPEDEILSKVKNKVLINLLKEAEK